MASGVECLAKAGVPLLMHEDVKEDKGSHLPTNSSKQRNGRIHAKDYKQLFVNSRKIYAGYCVFYYKQQQLAKVIKASASKKSGKAHQRNYYKRRIRHILRLLPLRHDVFLLAIVLKPHRMAFNHEKSYLAKKLRPLFSESKSVSYQALSI